MLNTARAKSLFAAIALAIGLQGALLWSMNEVAMSGAQQLAQTARATATVPALAALNAPREITLAPVTIVARRETPQTAPDLAPTEKLASREIQAILR